ncbi:MULTISPECIES: exodeoxyribonuclease VII large subunit [unclassified Proteiniphilum]|jgi:exodeoxyribonuclease VII large subunit|uniref:exodeoxyribonuclease VII large subunit n=1 Tax=unclassified Proteiniphilum TaxID=2622718 RepID=UPI00257CEE1A|nr:MULTISPECIES: exodeoxyribonuclease VII large subunit [unclassified Proteiniphilum]
MIESSFSLSELNRRVKYAIRNQLPDSYWVRAETSDVRRNQNGHCYLEFVEKDATTQSIIAKARGVIWSNVFQMLSLYFEKETGQQFKSGLNVLARVSVEFHELYGYSLSVVDIDPSFTVGEIARNRRLVLNKLKEEGVLTLNKELTMAELSNRIAVISSPTAAGYEDFRDQLLKNQGGFAFYTKLFPAIMQGERSEASIIAALERVFKYRNLFDAVAIIRGGGAASDLSCFDSYLLATNVAQFPLPVVSGIGHERDVTVLDVVAHTRAKTPTAVAEFFIGHLSKTATHLIDMEKRMITVSESVMVKERSDLFSLSKDVVHKSVLMLQKEVSRVMQMSATMKHSLRQLLQAQYHFVDTREHFVRAVSPENVLKRGYTLTVKNGKIVTSMRDIAVDDIIETRFKDGFSTSLVSKLEVYNENVKRNRL